MEYAGDLGGVVRADSADPSATLLPLVSTPLCEQLQAQVLAALTQEF